VLVVVVIVRFGGGELGDVQLGRPVLVVIADNGAVG
jgi:hypothetical protein